MAESCELEVNLIKNKESEIDYQAIYLENMNIDFAVGGDLINIYFQKAKHEVDKIGTEIYKLDKKINQD